MRQPGDPNPQLNGLGSEGRKHEIVKVKRASNGNGFTVATLSKDFQRHTAVVEDIGIDHPAGLVKGPVETKRGCVDSRVFVQSELKLQILPCLLFPTPIARKRSVILYNMVHHKF